MKPLERGYEINLRENLNKITTLRPMAQKAYKLQEIKP